MPPSYGFGSRPASNGPFHASRHQRPPDDAGGPQPQASPAQTKTPTQAVPAAMEPPTVQRGPGPWPPTRHPPPDHPTAPAIEPTRDTPTDSSPRTPATPGELARCQQAPRGLSADPMPPANPPTQPRPNLLVPAPRPPRRHQVDTRTLLTTPMYPRRSPIYICIEGSLAVSATYEGQAGVTGKARALRATERLIQQSRAPVSPYGDAWRPKSLPGRWTHASRYAEGPHAARRGALPMRVVTALSPAPLPRQPTLSAVRLVTQTTSPQRPSGQWSPEGSPWPHLVLTRTWVTSNAMAHRDGDRAGGRRQGDGSRGPVDSARAGAGNVVYERRQLEQDRPGRGVAGQGQGDALTVAGGNGHPEVVSAANRHVGDLDSCLLYTSDA